MTTWTRLLPLLPRLALALALSLALSACTDAAQAPAEAALKAGEAAVASLGEEVEKLAPEQTQAARDALASAKAFVAKQDFKGALAAAGEIPAKAKAALEAAQAKKDAAAAEAARVVAEAQAAARRAYDAAAAGASQRIEAIKAKLTTKGKKLPKGMTKDMLASARTDLGSVTEAWAVRAGRAAPPGPAVLVKDAVLVRTVPWVLPARVDMA